MGKHLLFDLDGTLTDPKVGITTCIQHALKKMKVEKIPEMDELLWCIGPPLDESFSILLPSPTEDSVALAIAAYRERFSTVGLLENQLYDGVKSMLAALHKTHRLFVATSKPHVFAKPIARHFEIESYFKTIYGAELSGVRNAKAEVIGYLLEQERISGDQCVMVGDRKHDIIGAKAHGMMSVGITWGYGSHNELALAGADHIVSTPGELELFLKSC